MFCLIKIVDGQPFEHPMLVENYLQLFPDTDLNNLPESVAWFERKLRPELPENSVFVQEESVYQFNGTRWTDVWLIRDMTEQEIEQTRIANEQMKIEGRRQQYNLNYEYYTQQLEECSDQDQRQLLQNCIDEISFGLSKVDEGYTDRELPIIKYPQKNELGIWVEGPNPLTKEEVARIREEFNIIGKSV